MSRLKLLSVCLALLMLAGCNLDMYNVQEILLSKDDISLTFKGEEQLVYDSANWQLGYNGAKNEFRVSDDYMADYFIIRCDADPTDEGQELKADVIWTMETTVKRYEGLKFEVRKVTSGGQVWLWNRLHGIGVVVRKL